jgi:hypothetical protein
MKKVLMVIGGIVLILVVLAVIFFLFVSVTSKKIICKSSLGNITIMYNDDRLTGYTTKGLTYDFTGQSNYAATIGVENYIDEFTEWFAQNTDGFCEIK